MNTKTITIEGRRYTGAEVTPSEIGLHKGPNGGLRRGLAPCPIDFTRPLSCKRGRMAGITGNLAWACRDDDESEINDLRVVKIK